VHDIIFGSPICCLCNLFYIRPSFLKLTVASYSALLIEAALIFQACLILVASVLF
jgi:hypothetical protein